MKTLEELLKKKNRLDGLKSELVRCSEVRLKALSEDRDCCVRLQSNNSESRCYMAPGVIEAAIQSQLELVEKELDPINKKIEAIELMLNS